MDPRRFEFQALRRDLRALFSVDVGSRVGVSVKTPGRRRRPARGGCRCDRPTVADWQRSNPFASLKQSSAGKAQSGDDRRSPASLEHLTSDADLSERGRDQIERKTIGRVCG